MNVRYVGPAKDYSGYGEAVRHDLISLLSVGVNITGLFPRYTLEIADFGEVGERIAGLENKPISYDVIILHTTPNVYNQYFEKGKYHVARVFWETDKLPPDFVENIEKCDEVWTGSVFNEAALRNSGITRPIKIIPQAIDTAFKLDNIKPYIVDSNEGVKFYSIFEWTARKNPEALLSAYWSEFSEKDNVSLTIKTYVDNFEKGKEDEVLFNIKKLKARLNYGYFAPVYLWRNLMDRLQIYRFHKTFDVFVSAHRGEGWGIPQMEALLVGNPIISTNCGGIHEYLEDQKDGLLMPFKLISLNGNTRNQQWYRNDQMWADVDINKLKSSFRYAYDNFSEVKKMGINGGKKIREMFSPEQIGQKMMEVLDERT